MSLIDMGVDLSKRCWKLTGRGRDVLLEAIRHLATRKRIRPLLDIVSRLHFDDLKWMFSVVGIARMPPGRFSDRKEWHELTEIIPLEVHAAMACRLWPKVFGERWPPKKPVATNESRKIVDVMLERAGKGRGLRHPRDVIELGDRTRKLLANQDRSKEPTDPEELKRQKKLCREKRPGERQRKQRQRDREGREQQALKAIVWHAAGSKDFLRITRMRVESAGAECACAVARVGNVECGTCRKQ